MFFLQRLPLFATSVWETTVRLAPFLSFLLFLFAKPVLRNTFFSGTNALLPLIIFPFYSQLYAKPVNKPADDR
jgi:hypothetical protein